MIYTPYSIYWCFAQVALDQQFYGFLFFLLACVNPSIIWTNCCLYKPAMNPFSIKAQKNGSPHPFVNC